MITGGAEGVGHIADVIERDLLPLAEDATRRAEIRVTAQLVRLAAEDYDRAVDVLMADRADLEPVLRDALPLLTRSGTGSPDPAAADTAAADIAAADTALADDVRERLADRPDGYRVSVLRARSDRDLRVLDAVHEALEGRPDAADLVLRIWQVLHGHAARRRFETPI